MSILQYLVAILGYPSISQDTPPGWTCQSYNTKYPGLCQYIPGYSQPGGHVNPTIPAILECSSISQDTPTPVDMSILQY